MRVGHHYNRRERDQEGRYYFVCDCGCGRKLEIGALTADERERQRTRWPPLSPPQAVRDTRTVTADVRAFVYPRTSAHAHR
jgi:hypothetical protein